MPGLHAINNKFSKQGFSVLGVTKFFANGSQATEADDMKAALAKTTPLKDMDAKTFDEHLKTFHARVKPSYPFVVASEDELKSFKVAAFPTLFLIDKAGNVAYVQVGGGRDKALEAVIERLLQAK